MSLSKKGRKLVDAAKQAVRDLCGDLSGRLLEQLAAIEDGLAETPLERRPDTRAGGAEL